MPKLFATWAVTTFAILSFARLGEAQSQWNEIIEAAKGEGTVVVIGPKGSETRDALTQGFQRKYPEIKVDHSGSAGAQLPPTLLAEQKPER
jgi:iron(III) transport system substrate-binding protein